MPEYRRIIEYNDGTVCIGLWRKTDSVTTTMLDDIANQLNSNVQIKTWHLEYRG